MNKNAPLPQASVFVAVPGSTISSVCHTCPRSLLVKRLVVHSQQIQCLFTGKKTKQKN